MCSLPATFAKLGLPLRKSSKGQGSAVTNAARVASTTKTQGPGRGSLGMGGLFSGLTGNATGITGG